MLKKEITFICFSRTTETLAQPIVDEAKKRGYVVTVTKNPFAKCEIGFYFDHVNFPRNSKFSIITLHDIIQQKSCWPNIWQNEPWNIYDIGFLPSTQWVDNWNQCSDIYYAKPRKGIYEVGWAKADTIESYSSKSYKTDFYKKYGLDFNKKTILYAPSWENDGKQDDFVQSTLPLDVNILIKQAAWDPQKYPEIVHNIEFMRALHKNNPRVVQLPNEANIFEAIAVSDVLVSEESSTMAEALMFGIPAVSVSNWLIPDVKPSRFPKCEYDFAINTTKEDLSKTLNDIILDFSTYKNKAERYSKANFSYIGSTSSMIMDVIDSFVEEKKCNINSLKYKKNKNIGIVDEISHQFIRFKKSCGSNYSVRYKTFGMAYGIAKNLYHRIQKN